MAETITAFAMKTCRGCGQVSARDNFPLKSRSTGLRWAYCEECMPAERARKRALQEASNQRRDARRAEGGPVDREPRTFLSAARIVLWLVQEERRLKRAWALEAQANFKGRGLLADHLGTSERQLSRLIDGQKYQRPHWNQQTTVTLDQFDKWLCHAGCPEVLKDLFPRLWEFEEEAAA
jgi:hypothetical protein